MAIDIWHNPRCSKSRETLNLLQEKGIEPNIYLYLEENPNSQDIKAIISKLGIPARALLRNSEDAYKEQNLKDPSLSDDQLIDAMVATPKLIQRPSEFKHERNALCISVVLQHSRFNRQYGRTNGAWY